jgi:hypothetical protein
VTDSTTSYMTAKEAAILADELSQCGGKHAVAARVAMMEQQVPPPGGPAHPGDAAAGALKRRVPAAAGEVMICDAGRSAGPAP